MYAGFCIFNFCFSDPLWTFFTHLSTLTMLRLLEQFLTFKSEQWSFKVVWSVLFVVVLYLPARAHDHDHVCTHSFRWDSGLIISPLGLSIHWVFALGPTSDLFISWKCKQTKMELDLFRLDAGHFCLVLNWYCKLFFKKRKDIKKMYHKLQVKIISLRTILMCPDMF